MDARNLDVARVFRALDEAQTLGIVDAYTLDQPSLEQVFIAVLRAPQTTTTTSAIDDDPLPRPVVDDDDALPDAADLVARKTCCGLSHRAHKFLALAAGLCAVAFFLALSGLVGGDVSYDDDARSYDDDASRQRGCHRQQGQQSPCSTYAVTLASFPFVAALVVFAVGCCGCCCCLKAPPRRQD